MKKKVRNIISMSSISLLAVTSYAHAHPGHEHASDSILGMIAHNLVYPGAFLILATVAIAGTSYILRKRHVKK